MLKVFGRPDATGRSSGIPVPKDAKLLKIPAPFAAIPVAVMQSDAFQTLGIHARRVLDALLIEHVSHASRENGRLVVTYDQLVANFHVSRRKIKGAIDQLERNGLIVRTAIGSGNRRLGLKAPSLYRLTFLSSLPDRMNATDEWREFVATSPTKKTRDRVPL